ncbi:MAG: hypothetical protein E7330_02350 [Clostridiales bacterium]|nr:hypothetical protein [Clostridiales bacterium]
MPSNLLTPEMFANFDLFTLFKPLAGIYLLVWCAILGKGKILRNEHLKCDEKVFRRNMRLICAAAGLLLLLSGVIDIAGDMFPGAFIDPASVVGWIIWGLGLTALIGIMVYSVAMTDREAMRKADEEAAKNNQGSARGGYSRGGRPAQPKMPSSAFEFDNDDDQ